MTLWRVSDHPGLDGIGGLRTSARWHTIGRRIVYCAPNPATALVEVLVHIEVDVTDLPDTLPYLEIEAPETMSTRTVDVDGLGRNWQKNDIATQGVGDEWRVRGKLLFSVCLLSLCLRPGTFSLTHSTQRALS